MKQLSLGLVLGLMLALDGGTAGARCAPVDAAACNLGAEKGVCQLRPLRFWVGDDGGAYCEQMNMVLQSSPVIPDLRPFRCTFIAKDAVVRLIASNYLSRKGPKHGDTWHVTGGTLEIDFFGQYRSSLEPSEIWFANEGPDSSLSVQCNAFGPA